MREEPSGKRKAVWVTCALLALIALYFLFHKDAQTTKPTAPPRANESDPASTYAYGNDLAGGNPSGAPSAGPQGSASGPPPAVPEQPQLPPESPPYSPDTLALAEAIDPEVTAWDEVPSDKDGTFLIRVRPAQYATRSPDPIVIELEIVDKTKKRQNVTRAEASIKGTRSGPKPTIYTETFKPIADGSYRATFEAADKPDLRGHVLVQAEVQLENGKVYFVSTAVLYTRAPDGKLTGTYRDEKRLGSLFIAAEVQIDKPGTFQVRGELLGPAYEPIAESKITQTLEPGVQRLELHFYGKAISDRKVDGPYRLMFVYLSQLLDDGYEAIGPVVHDAYLTAAYRAAEFTTARYEPPQLQGEIVGPESPSQLDKPPPLFKVRPEGPTTTMLQNPGQPVSVAPEGAFSGDPNAPQGPTAPPPPATATAPPPPPPP